MSLRQWAFLSAGFASLALGILGAMLPLLPTTPFILLAAWCFGKSSPRWEEWLRKSPAFGPMLRDWREYRGVRPQVKLLATLMILTASAVTCWLSSAAPLIIAATAVLVSIGLCVVWRLPTIRPPLRGSEITCRPVE